MEPQDERLEPFRPLGDVEPAQLRPTSVTGYTGGSFSDVAAPPTLHQGGAALVTDVEFRERNSRNEAAYWEAYQQQWCQRHAPHGIEVLRVRVRQLRTSSSANLRAEPTRRESHRSRPGHRRVRSSTRAGPSSDSDSDGPGDAGPPARRRVIVDRNYVVIGLAPA